MPRPSNASAATRLSGHDNCITTFTIGPIKFLSTRVSNAVVSPSGFIHLRQCRPAEDLPNETFQWLLLDIRSQVLSICVNYLHCVHFGLIGRPSSASCLVPASTTPAPADVTSRERTEVLRLLFSLAEAQIGQVGIFFVICA